MKPEDIFDILKDIQTRVKTLESGSQVKKLTIPANDTGSFVPKVVSSDPSSPKNNEVWINSTSNTLKWNKSGSIKTVTLS